MSPHEVSDDGDTVYREQFAHGAFTKVARDPAAPACTAPTPKTP